MPLSRLTVIVDQVRFRAGPDAPDRRNHKAQVSLSEALGMPSVLRHPAATCVRDYKTPRTSGRNTWDNNIARIDQRPVALRRSLQPGHDIPFAFEAARPAFSTMDETWRVDRPLAMTI